MRDLKDNSEPIAHTRETDTEVHLLSEHLDEVGRRSQAFAEKFGNGDWGNIAGQWHDLGKYKPEFQNYIRQSSAKEASEAHIEDGKRTAAGRVNHTSMGALHAQAVYPGGVGQILAYLIASHHTGLLNWLNPASGKTPLNMRLQDDKELQVYQNLKTTLLPAERLNLAKPTSKPPTPTSKLALSLWIRLLFSCLVDADFLDTELFMDSKKAAQRDKQVDISVLLALFETEMAKKITKLGQDISLVNQVRAKVLNECIAHAAWSPGLFSLNVPTGGGKTLSSMAFALHHAKCHNKERIIYVIPYTSIIEQTASIFKDIFGDDNVIEHHSALDPDQEDAKSRLACENWDAPIVVTTNVQFFESLFAAKTSRVRKLHNIVNSVVILDEAQLLPTAFLNPILHAMQELSGSYGVSLVLCTATQPVLDAASLRAIGLHQGKLLGLQNVRELMSDPMRLHEQLKRVTVQVPSHSETPLSWEELASALGDYPQVLCIVNRRQDARELFGLMPKEHTIHLSALMCAAHRSQVIADIKQRLQEGKPVRVISTQLVEAGVDVDFPVVYRAMAGLDSIAQAAGRCNREGKLIEGKMVVFVPPTASPPGLLCKARQAADHVFAAPVDTDPLSVSMFSHYFGHLYSQLNSFDEKEILHDLTDKGGVQIEFRTAADNFQLIDDAASVPVLVPYGQGAELIELLRSKGPERWLMRKLQRYVVTIRPHERDALLRQKEIQLVNTELYTPTYTALYDERLGLLTQSADLFSKSESLIAY
jgi:CRISPR-associated endonuclease/helicase Cas3